MANHKYYSEILNIFSPNRETEVRQGLRESKVKAGSRALLVQEDQMDQKGQKGIQEHQAFRETLESKGLRG